MPNDLLAKVMDAAVYAAMKHQYQRRAGYGRLPYMNHLLKVTDALIRIGGERDEALLLAAVLHDVLEDTDATHEELSRRFGREAADIVQELTDDMSIPYMERKWLQVKKADQLSEKARKIRIVDKATNIRDILSYPLDWPLEKKKNYLDNSVQVVARIRGANPRLDAWFDETVGWAKQRLAEMEKSQEK
ncbi:MAG: bifunctional (p)ppGpp synthetase/guanosine-3',5'-bis(diphosphate) 3'-pyrophosphohydrolase [Phaeodactylibacter sp.]|nr:bifunctional (p)ppGpp synthetase/guanosine-3',5'-bis(diphosphate) 3'-pyrophosphohydrolase [Phaeodactylibacter sp.]MCB9294722.1 bifunctional (p)ppGpp synthetase/guanosine-3',5'-bis(diphosphate) 3'-pyrophosphohydrolase [Lewinellaceae bacterium]